MVVLLFADNRGGYSNSNLVSKSVRSYAAPPFQAEFLVRLRRIQWVELLSDAVDFSHVAACPLLACP
jgi:hypothetical protein